MSHIVLVSGGIKSGKSEFAEYLASKEKKVTYIALSETRPKDDLWKERILIFSFHNKSFGRFSDKAI